ncbi:conserved hypothetical protein [Ricinus communis]|uniref:Nodulin-like domain-containing protein n=1 Tax=Ricinus communis TaxID=3988 RepID=B9SD48_RICCO|nr:conserved hypothetical protein [Ricinus communis]
MDKPNGNTKEEAGALTGLSLAAGGWNSNLIVFLISEFNMSSIAAAQVNTVILGCNSIFAIAGAILADSFFASFSVITVFSFVSFLVIL